MRVEVEAVQHVTSELVDATRSLLPQLSASAAPLSAEDLTRIANHQATTLFIARRGGAIVGMLTWSPSRSPPACGRGSKTWSSTSTPAVKASARP
jgi:hypothetical protein